MKTPLVVAAPLLLALATGFACASKPDEPEFDFAELEARLLPVGTPAPNVTMIDMSDQALPLSSLRGKTVLVNFWFYG